MRIIGGIHRSRKIRAPKGHDASRPITDRVKENLFNRLMAIGVTGDGRVLDVFCGIGSLGLEALSRGAEHCTFVERDRSTRQLLEQNLRDLRLSEQGTVLAVDVLTRGWLGLLAKHSLRLVFCDPPYALTRQAEGMKQINSLLVAISDVVELDGVCVLRTERDVAPGQAAGWDRPRTFVEGTMALHLYVRTLEGARTDL